jgi:inorganic pyrophosphatase
MSCSGVDDNPTVIREFDYLHGFEALTPSGLVNILIEIPAGSNQKWEVNKDTGHLEWQVVGDSLRVIPYLPYPANYGMVPGTWLPFEDGGDNDPIDIFLLGPAHERGTVQKGRVIGVIKMIDGGEQDDKLIAIDPDSWFYSVETVEQLTTQFPGIIDILTVWLANYKGEGVIEIESVKEYNEAFDILMKAVDSFRNRSF